MREEPPTQEELALAKDSYLNSFVFNFDTEREILSRRATYEYHNYPADFLRQTRDAIEEVTTEDVLSAARKYLYPDESHILVVGNGDRFSRDLSTLTKGGTVDTIDVSIPREPPSTEQAAPTAADRKAMRTGRKLMSSAKEALGGSAFDRLESMRVVTQQQGRTSTLVVKLPNKMRVERGGVTIVSNGQTVRMKRGGTSRTLPASVQGRIMGQLWQSVPYLMANLDHDELSVQGQADTTISETAYKAVAIQPPVGPSYTLYLDAQSMRPGRLSFEQTNPRSGATVSVTQTFGDYREVNGMTVPFKIETVRSTSKGEKTVTGTIQELKVNIDPEDDLFTFGGSSSK